MDLAKAKCVPCEGGVEPLKGKKIQEFLSQLKSDWLVVDAKLIKREFKFKNFKESIEFVNKVAEIAEREGHHPDIHIFYNRVTIELWTHAIGGLFDNDFILAAKIEELI